jgi:hypothetical protein
MLVMRRLERLLVLALVCFAALVLASCAPAANESPPVVRAGVIDVGDWDFLRDGPLPLEGTWKVDWSTGEPASPERASTALADFDVPGFVQNAPTRVGWEAGTGTLALHLRILDARRALPRDIFVPTSMPSRLLCASDGVERGAFVACIARPQADPMPEEMAPTRSRSPRPTRLTAS